MHDFIICGELVVLRLAHPGDAELLVKWLQDPRVYQWWGGFPVPEAEVRRKYTGGRLPQVVSYIVEAEGEPVGYAQSCRTDQSSGNLDVFLAPEAWGRGLGADAARTLARHLTAVNGWQRVTADPERNNYRALKLWRKAGFVPTGRQSEVGGPELVFHPDG